MKGVRSGGLRQKSASRSGAVPLPTFFGIHGLAQRGGVNFFACVQDFFDEALSPQYGSCHLERDKLKGNVLRGGVVLNMILLGMLLGAYYEIYCFIYYRLSLVLGLTGYNGRFKFFKLLYRYFDLRISQCSTRNIFDVFLYPVVKMFLEDEES